jgi:hypothetical protein
MFPNDPSYFFQVVVAIKLYVYIMTTFMKKETVNPITQFSRKNLKRKKKEISSSE